MISPAGENQGDAYILFMWIMVHLCLRLVVLCLSPLSPHSLLLSALSLAQDSGPSELFHLGFLELWLPHGFGQERHQRETEGREERSWGIYSLLLSCTWAAAQQWLQFTQLRVLPGHPSLVPVTPLPLPAPAALRVGTAGILDSCCC